MMQDASVRRNQLRAVGFAVALFGAAMSIWAIPVIRESGLRLNDTYFRVAPAPRQPSQVVLVLVDEASLRQYGRWPWSRVLLGRLTTNLAQAGARVIGLDILLPETQSPEADRALGAAFAASGRAVIVDKIGIFPDGPHWIEPLPDLAHAVVAVGHAQAIQDVDGICRRFPPLELTLSGPRWAFALEMARRIAPQQASAFVAAYGVPFTDDGGAISTARPITVPIAYRRDTFQIISAAAVLDNRGLAAVRGRPVLVGFGPTEIGDRISTPLTGELSAPGVEVHAHILDSILSARRLRETPFWAVALLLFPACLVIVMALRRWRGWAAVGVLIVGAAGVYAGALLAFISASVVIPAGPFLGALVLGPLLIYTADFVIVERSITQQLRELRRWLAFWRKDDSAPASDLSWRLALLRDLQRELGSLYELHKTLLEASQDPVAIFDPQGILLLYNQAFERTGTDKSGLTLQQLRARLRPHDDVPLLETGAGLEGEAYLNDELYSVRIVPLPPTTLSPGGGSIVTLTSLRTRVERDRARAEALGFITHELRTPLVAIQGFAELMIEYPRSPANARAPETIFRESKRLLALINSYLDVLRLDAGARPLEVASVEMVTLVLQVFELLRPIAEAAQMKLVLDTSGPVFVIGDGRLLSGAVLNLVSNAIKYGKPGTQIRARCFRDGEEAIVSVENAGNPISRAEAPRVFETYYRSQQAEAVKPGWGLGLAFVKRIAEKHGGSVRMESGAAATTFTIQLPAEAGIVAAKGTS